MRTTDAQVRKLMDEMRKHGELKRAALRSGMTENTARKYVRAGRYPSELESPRDWRTRDDPFEADWPGLRERLREAPELEAKALFEDLVRRKPESYQPGQVRTLQRRVKQWRAEEGPPKRIFFPQEHRPGEAMQTDFTWATELGIAIGGEPFPHMLCHAVLPYSNWQWVTVCHSESMSALRRGVQAALGRLGRRPQYHQTDNSTGGHARLANGQAGLQRGLRGPGASLRDDAADDRGRREGAERRCRVAQRSVEAPPGAALAAAGQPGVSGVALS